MNKQMVTWNNKQSNVKDSKGDNISFQRCDDWGGTDPNVCTNSAPTGTTGWMPCFSGSDPRSIACSPYSTSNNCLWGQDCYAIQGLDPTWSSPYSGCDNAGNNLTIEACTGWVATKDNPGGNPKFCNTATNKPKNIKSWINCNIGSSPAGMDPNNKATVCQPISKTFGCVPGQYCYAITSQEKVSTCPDISPAGIINSLNPFSWFTKNILACFIVCFFVLLLSSSGAILMSSK
jgi:hypothetical protein